MEINGTSKSQFVYDLMKKGLQASNLREQVIANNISNVNTKEYKAYKVSFEDTLKDNVEGFSLKTTNEKHIKEDESSFGDIKLQEEDNYSMRQDGNGVDIDAEEANQAANTLMNYSLISQLNNRITMKRNVISGR